MAVRKRVLNSTLPFSAPNLNKQKAFCASYSSSGDESEQGSEEAKEEGKKEVFIQRILSVITHGTAKHVGTEPLCLEKSPMSIIAQAECESQDSQEFCPNNSRLPKPQHNTPTESLSIQETEPPSPTHNQWSQTQLTSIPIHLHYAQQDEVSLGSDLSGGGDCSLAVAALRGSVSQGDRCYVPAFAKELEREVQVSEDDSESESKSYVNEGILFNEKQQPVDYEYREGREYDLCERLRQGSYGDVYKGRDRTTGFTFAAKKIPLSKFRSEEVGTWSALQSHRVVELFGTVREGSNIILFMELKKDSVAQLLKERGRFPEDLSLHYLGQVLDALMYMHKKRIVHMDIKADNVLLSEDGKDAFLCDFGQSERTDEQGKSISASQGPKGTETHMSPEVVRGERVSTKTDLWSSCCMFLHMLNGCQPWTRYYSRPLYLKIADEPPPVRETPPDCSSHTAEVIKAGLQKDPEKRDTAEKLKLKVREAIKNVGGPKGPIRGGAYLPPLRKQDVPGSSQSDTPTSSDHTPSSGASELQWMSSGKKRSEGGQQNQRKESMNKGTAEEPEKEKKEKMDKKRNEPSPFPRSQNRHPSPSPRCERHTTGPEQELRKLETEFCLESLSQLHSVEKQEEMFSVLSSDCPSSKEHWEKRDSGRWSLGSDEDFCSDVFSYNSQSDGQSFSVDWLGRVHQPPPRCFDGVDVCIRDFNGKCLRIREAPRVTVGHIAKGISEQISLSVFSLQSEDGRMVAHDEEVQKSGLFLRCVPAPDCNHALGYKPASCGCHASSCRHASCCSSPWKWRIQNGELQTLPSKF
ncbi:mitogen-activated protein kinase kinase kinase 14 [Chanos chanos]|uniref:Mitogen-activated protein kinase kinase kinase 14 n=1 Tax=Chanos chanos TaxID=29144 RepID=A0A6J2X069_CHACN|nr:mitogen-activated protein kinase kinase kinase 14 [Chanos chanos]